MISSSNEIILTNTNIVLSDRVIRSSIKSLEVQGGSFSNQEIIKFERMPYFSDAVKSWRWDEKAKSPSMVTPPLGHVIPYIEQSIAKVKNSTQ